MDDDTIAFGEEEEAAKNANRLKYILMKRYVFRCKYIFAR